MSGAESVIGSIIDKVFPYLLGGSGILGVWLTYKRASNKDKSESELRSNSQSFEQLQEVVSELRTEVDRVKKDHSEERRLWHEERQEFTKEIKALSSKLFEYEKDNAVLKNTVELLKKHDTTAVKKIAKEI